MQVAATKTLRGKHCLRCLERFLSGCRGLVFFGVKPMSTDAELAGAIEIDVSQFIAGLNSASNALNSFAAHFNSLNPSFAQTQGGMGSVGSSAVAMGTIMGNVATSIINRFADMAASAVGTGISFLKMQEQANTAFTNLLGSADRAKGFMKELADFATRTPFELSGLTQSAQKLTAMGFAAQDVIPMLEAVGNAVAAMGGSAETVNRVTTALTQMQAKGKVSAEEILQLAEAGIPAWEILANRIGVSIPEAMKLGEKGAISSKLAIDALVDGMSDKFGGMMDAQSKTFSGLMSTISDTSQQVLGSVLQPLFSSATEGMQKFVDLLPDIQKGLEGVSDSAKLAGVAFTGLSVAAGIAGVAIAAALGGPAALVVVGLGVEVAAVAAAIISNFGQIRSAITAWTGGVTVDFNTVMRWIGRGADAFAFFARSVIMGVDVIGTSLKIMAQGFQGVMGILQGFGTSLKGLITFDPTAVITGVAQMQGAFTKFDTGVSTQITALMNRTRMNIEDNVSNLNGKYANAFESFGGKVVKAFNRITESAEKVKKPVDSLLGGLKPAGLVVPSAKGAKGASNELEKILKEQLDLVNNWTKETQQALTLNIDVWKMLPGDIRKILTDTSEAFKKSIDDTKAWGAAMQAAFIKAAGGDLTKSLVVTVKGTKISIESPKIALKDAGAIDINPNLWAKLLQTETGRKQIKAIQTTALELGRTINFVIPKIDQDFSILNGTMAGAAIASKAATEQMGNGIEAWEKRTKKSLDFVKGKMTWADLFAGVMEAPPRPIDPDKFGLGKDLREAVNKLKDDIQSSLGDGIGGVLVGLAGKFHWHLDQVKGWANDVSTIVNNLPAAFGDAARRIYSSLNTWIQFANGVLSILNKLNSSIPSSVSKIGESIAGMLKKSGASSGGFDISSVSADIGDLMKFASKETQTGTKAIADAATKNASKFSSAFGLMSSAMAGFTTNMAVTAATGSKLTGGIVGGLTGAFSGFLAGGAKGSALGPHGAIIGAAIGGGISLLGSLLGGGGKSKEQKAAEEQAKMKAGLDMQKTAQDISNAALEGLKKGLDVLEGIADFANIPDKQFSQFMKAYEATIKRVISFAGTLKAESLTAAKAFGESVQPIADSLSGMVQFYAALPSVAIPIKERVEQFVTAMVDTVSILSTKLEEAAIVGTKGVSKWSVRVKEIVGMLSDSAGAFNAISSSMAVPIEKLTSFVESVKVSVELIKQAADWHDLYGVKAAAKYAERSKAMMELLTSSASAFDAVNKSGGANAANIAGFITGLKNVVVDFVAMAATLPDLTSSASVTGALKSIVDVFAPAVTGMNALPNYSRVAHEQMTLFTEDLMAIAGLMSQAVKTAPMDMLNAAADFSEKMKPVVDLFAPAVAGLSALKGTSKIGISEAQGFIGNLVTIANLISVATQTVSTEMLAKASDFAVKMKPVIDLIIPALDGMKRLREEGASALVSIEGFKTNVMLIAQSMIDLNGSFDGEALAGAARFSDIAKRIFEFTSTAVTAFQGVSSLNWSVLQSFSTVQTAIGLALNKFISLADSFSAGALTAVNDFLATALNITSAVSTIGGFFKSYEPFGDSLLVINSDFDKLSSWMTSTEARAATWQTQSENIAKHIQSMIATLSGGLGALRGIAGGINAPSNLTLQVAGAGGVASDLAYTRTSGRSTEQSSRSTTTVQHTYHFHFHGGAVGDAQIEKTVIKAVESAQRKGRQ